MTSIYFGERTFFDGTKLYTAFCPSINKDDLNFMYEQIVAEFLISAGML